MTADNSFELTLKYLESLRSQDIFEGNFILPFDANKF